MAQNVVLQNGVNHNAPIFGQPAVCTKDLVIDQDQS